MKSLAKTVSSIAVVLALMIGASGCGLPDYQRQMDAQRERVNQFDEANRALDDPIDVPKIQDPDAKDGAAKEVKAWPFDIYLRLPRGYSTYVKEKKPYVGFFFRYATPGEGALSIFVAATLLADPKQKEREEGKFTPAELLSGVEPALRSFPFKETKNAPLMLVEKRKAERRDFKVLTPYPETAGRVTYTFLTYTTEGMQLKDHLAFDVYLHEKGARQVCIVVQRSLQPNAAQKASIDACLGSLDISGDASTKRADYKKAKGS